MNEKLIAALKRAVAALNVPRNFRTAEGIKSYELIPQLEEVLKEAKVRKPAVFDLAFPGVPDADMAIYSEGVMDAIEQLDFDHEYDETSPPDENGLSVYKVCGVQYKFDGNDFNESGDDRFDVE